MGGSIETAYNREEFMVEVDGKQAFNVFMSRDDAEGIVMNCLTGHGWPKDRSHYRIFKRQIITMETPWRPVK